MWFNMAKDHVNDAFEDFWKSGLKTSKINSPKLKTTEDDNWDAFWGRGAYIPQPKVHYEVPKRVVSPKYQQVKPMSASDRAAILKEQLILEQLRAKQALKNSQNTGQVIGGAIRFGRYGAKVGVPAAQAGAKAGIEAARAGANAARAGLNFTRRAVSSVANRGAFNTARGTSAGKAAAGVVDWAKNKMPKSKPVTMSQKDVSSYADQLE